MSRSSFPMFSFNSAILSVQFSHSAMFDSVTPWTAAHHASLSITNSWSLFKLMSIESVMPSNHLILCFPLLLLPSIFPSIRVFSSVLDLRIRWPKYWSFSFSISPSNEHPGLISFRMDWLDLLAVQRTLKSLLQYHSSKVKLLSHVQLFLTPQIVAYQAPLSMGFSRREYWSGLPFPSPGDLPNLGVEPRSPALQADALLSEPLVLSFLYSPTLASIHDYWKNHSFDKMDLFFFFLAK